MIIPTVFQINHYFYPVDVKCLNCSTVYIGKFCPTCGQKSSTHRITFAGIMHDIPHSVFHLDKGFFFTFVELLYRPGKAIAGYLSGMRVRYFSPLAYLFILSAAATFVHHLALHYLHQDKSYEGILFPGIAAFFDHYPALMLCLLVPFISLWSWLFHRDKSFNYWEHFVFNTYLVAQFNLFFIVNNLLHIFGLYKSGSVTPLIICFMAYLSFAYTGFFFRNKVTAKRIVKNTALFFLIALTLITGLSVTGFMTPWWNF